MLTAKFHNKNDGLDRSRIVIPEVRLRTPRGRFRPVGGPRP